MTKPRILIIEDEFLIARELEARLKSLDYAVVGSRLSLVGFRWRLKQRCNSGAYRWNRLNIQVAQNGPLI